MKIPIAIVSLICIVLVAFTIGSRKHKTGWEKLSLKGRVKSVNAKQYSDTGGADKTYLISDFSYVFDSVGNEIEENNHYVKEDSYRTIYTYNRKEQCSKTIMYIYIGLMDTEKMTTLHIYDSNGDLVEDHYDSIVGPKTKYTYDSIGNLKAYYTNNPDDTVFRMTGGFKYDDKGNTVEYDYYYPSGLLQGKRIDAYSSDGKIVKSDMYWDNNSDKSSGGVKLKASGNYDENGNSLEWTEYNPDGSVKEKTVNKTTYDKKGNMVKQVVLKNDKPVEHTEYEIVYY